MIDWTSHSRPDHPDDADLMAAAAGIPADETASHVRHCDTCAARVEAHARAWQAVRDGVAAEADAAFTDARLERQRAHVLRRLAQHGRAARVIRFPVSPRPVRTSRQVARRWVAAAAAAGLLVGVAAGRLLDDRARFAPRADRLAASGVGRQAPLAAPGEPAVDGRSSDEAFLVELEMAVATPRIEPLRALDALTPRLRDQSRGDIGR